MHTNNKLFELATKNAQKNAFKSLVWTTDDIIKNIFENCEKLYHPETPEKVKIAISGCLNLNKEKNNIFDSLTTSSFSKARSWFEKKTVGISK